MNDIDRYLARLDMKRENLRGKFILDIWTSHHENALHKITKMAICLFFTGKILNVPLGTLSVFLPFQNCAPCSFIVSSKCVFMV